MLLLSKTPRLLFAALLVFGGLLAIQPASATATCTTSNTFPVVNNGVEDFNGYSNGAQIPAGNCLVDDNNANGYIAPAGSYFGGENFGSGGVYFDPGGDVNSGLRVANVCDYSENPSEGAIRYEFDTQFFGFPSAGHYGLWGFVGAPVVGTGNVIAALAFDSAGAAGVYVRAGTGAGIFSAFPLAPAQANTGHPVHGYVRIDPANDGLATCTSASVEAGIYIGGQYYQYTTTLGAGLMQPVIQSGDVTQSTGAVTYGVASGGIWDNLTVSGATTTTPGVIFCPDAFINEDTGTGDSPNYGYNYRRGGTFFDQEDGDVSGVGLSTGYLYAATTSEATWDYSAKGLTVSTKAAHQNITLEAGEDAATSTFRINFMTNSGGTPSVTTKGNGLNTGNFANHAEAQIMEAGNVWQVSLWYVTGGGSRTQIGPSVNYGDSNDATPFTVYLDTRAAQTFLAVHANGVEILSSNGTGNNAAAFRTAFADDPIFDFWLVGSGGTFTANTAVDENVQHGDNTDDEGGHDSTCIFDDVGTATCLGTCGVLPASHVPSPPGGGGGGGGGGGVLIPGTEIPEGWTEAAFNAFLGVIIMAAIGGGMWGVFDKHWIALAIGSTMGFILALVFQLFSLWTLILVVLLCVTFIFLRVKRSAGAPG